MHTKKVDVYGSLRPLLWEAAQRYTNINIASRTRILTLKTIEVRCLLHTRNQQTAWRSCSIVCWVSSKDDSQCIVESGCSSLHKAAAVRRMQLLHMALKYKYQYTSQEHT